MADATVEKEELIVWCPKRRPWLLATCKRNSASEPTVCLAPKTVGNDQMVEGLSVPLEHALRGDRNEHVALLATSTLPLHRIPLRLDWRDVHP